MHTGDLDTDEEAGQLLRLLVPLADGTRSIDQLVAEAAKLDIGREAVEEFLVTLKSMGLAVFLGEDPGPDEEKRPGELPTLRWLSSLTSEPNQLFDRLIKSRWVVVGLTTLSGLVIDCLASVGVENPGSVDGVAMNVNGSADQRVGRGAVRVSSDDLRDTERPDFAVIVMEGRRNWRELQEINDTLIDLGTPSILVHHEGLGSRIGPLVEPKRSCCYRALHAGAERHFGSEGHNPLSPSQSAALQPFLVMASSLAVGAGFAHLADPGLGVFRNSMLELEWLPFSVREHRLLKDPRCPACGRRRVR